MVSYNSTSSSSSEVKILCLKFVLDRGTEKDRDYILSVVQKGIDKHAYSTTKRVEYRDFTGGTQVAYYRIAVTYTHHFKTRHDERSRKVLFKLRLKYPDIKLIA